MTELGALQSVVDAAVAVTLAGPGWEDGTLTLPGGTALAVRVCVFLDDEPSGGTQRMGATILCARRACVDEPVNGTTVVVAGQTWTVRSALEQVVLWRMRAWADV